MSTFQFAPGAARDYIGTSIAAYLITIFTFGLASPWAICMLHSWKARNTLFQGRPLKFTGTGVDLIGKWIVWWFLTIITLGLYSFIWYPRYVKWVTEHTELS